MCRDSFREPAGIRLSPIGHRERTMKTLTDCFRKNDRHVVRMALLEALIALPFHHVSVLLIAIVRQLRILARSLQRRLKHQRPATAGVIVNMEFIAFVTGIRPGVWYLIQTF